MDELGNGRVIGGLAGLWEGAPGGSRQPLFACRLFLLPGGFFGRGFGFGFAGGNDLVTLFDEAFQFGPVFLAYDITTAVFGAAEAGMILPGFEVEAVIEAEFGSFRDVLGGDEPDGAADDLGLTIRLAGVVDEPGIIPRDVAVDVVFFIEDEDINRALAAEGAAFDLGVAAAGGFRLGDFVALVVDDAGAPGDIAGGEDALIVNGGLADDIPGFGRGGGHGGGRVGETETAQGAA